MPLLCISLLALLLLPLSLSCVSKRTLEDVRNDYMAIVQIDLNKTRGSIATLLQNSSCSELKHKLPSCISEADVMNTLHFLTCKMKNLRLSHTDGLATSVLVTSVLNSLQIPCPCLEKPTKRPNVTWKRTGTAMRKRRNEQKKSRREQRLCKANAILSTVTECYELLNSLVDT